MQASEAEERAMLLSLIGGGERQRKRQRRQRRRKGRARDPRKQGDGQQGRRSTLSRLPDSQLTTGSRQTTSRSRLTQTTVSPLILALFISFVGVVVTVVFLCLLFPLPRQHQENANVPSDGHRYVLNLLNMLVDHRPPREQRRGGRWTVVVVSCPCTPAKTRLAPSVGKKTRRREEGARKGIRHNLQG